MTVSIVATQYAKAVLKIWEQASIDRGTAHAQYHVSGYFDEPDTLKMETSFSAEHPILMSLANDSMVEAISRRLLLEGIISAKGKTVYFLGKGVDGPAELKVSTQLFRPSPENGTFIDAASPHKIVLGRGLAEALDLHLGDEANLMLSTIYGSVNGIDVMVGGIIDLPIAILSKRLLYLDLGAAQKAVEMSGRFNELAVRLKPSISPFIWVAKQNASSASERLDLKGWWDIDTIIVKAENLWDAVVRIVSLLLFITAGLSVLNMILMLVSEQIIEIGTLMALGAKRWHIFQLIGCQAFLIGTSGALIGAFFANSLLYVMGRIGIPFESPFGGGFFMVHPATGFVVTFIAMCSGIFVALGASILPAYKASKLEPVLAFRGQIT